MKQPHRRGSPAAPRGGSHIDPRASVDTAQWMSDSTVRNGLLAADAMGVTADERALVGGGERRDFVSVPSLPRAPSNAYARIMQADPGMAAVTPYAPRVASYTLAPAMEEVGTVRTTSSTPDHGGVDGVTRRGGDGTLPRDSAHRKRARAVAYADAAHDIAVARDAGFLYTDTPHAAAAREAAAEFGGSTKHISSSEPARPALGIRAATAWGPQEKESLTFLAAWKASLLPDGGKKPTARGQATVCPTMPLRITFWVVTLLFLLALAGGIGAIAVATARDSRSKASP